MSNRLIKLIIITDEDTAGMIADYSDLPIKEREHMPGPEFAFYDKNGISHQLHFVHAEEV